MKTTIYAADLFCGAGGTSTGLLAATKRLGKDVKLLAINHWDVAIDTHSANHPHARHMTTGLETVVPKKVVPGGRLDLLWASPACTHHSVARGGRPRCDQSRAQPHLLLDWLSQLYVKRLLIENVPEFVNWGPLGADGKPLKSKKGVLFEDFLQSLKALQYRFEWRVLCCADYGDPTTRKRFFLQAIRGRGKIRWPEPTHAKVPAPNLKPWVPARDIIDWALPGTSIFRRDKPLAVNTLRRIEAGIRKFWGEWAEPFLIVLRGTRDGTLDKTAIRLDSPLPTLTAGGGHVGLVEPLLTVMNNWPSQQDGYPLDRPLPTQTAGNHFGMVEPFIIPQHSGGEVRDADSPIPTVTTISRHALVQPFVARINNGRSTENPDCRVRSLDEPIGTQTGSNTFGVIEPFIATVSHGTPDGNFARRVASIDEPLRTVTGSGDAAMIQPFITTAGGAAGQGRQPHTVAETIGTITGSDRRVLVQPFLVSFYGNGEALPVTEPIATITTKDRFGVVQQYGLDILFRMLQPHELALAHSFPAAYHFAGTKTDVVKQIGNSVPSKTAEALCLASLADSA